MDLYIHYPLSLPPNSQRQTSNMNGSELTTKTSQTLLPIFRILSSELNWLFCFCAVRFQQLELESRSADLKSATDYLI